MAEALRAAKQNARKASFAASARIDDTTRARKVLEVLLLSLLFFIIVIIIMPLFFLKFFFVVPFFGMPFFVHVCIYIYNVMPNKRECIATVVVVVSTCDVKRQLFVDMY